jgi:hypothetical protein
MLSLIFRTGSEPVNEKIAKQKIRHKFTFALFRQIGELELSV